MTKRDQHFSLAHFILALIKHWKLFLCIMFLFFIGGIIQFKNRPGQPFRYITSIQIGINGKGEFIKELNGVRAGLETAYIPKVLSDHARENHYYEQRYVVKVKLPEGETREEKKSGIVTLESYADEKEGSVIFDIHKRVVDLLLMEHKELIEFVRRSLAQEKSQAELQFDEFKEQEKIISKKEEILNNTSALLKKQIDATRNLLTQTEPLRMRLFDASKSKETLDQQTMSNILFLDNTINQQREKLRGLEDRFFASIPGDMTTLQKENAELKRKEGENTQKIADLDFQMQNLQVTNVILEPSRLPKTLRGGSPYQSIAIFIGIGFFVSSFIIVLVEFLMYGKKKRNGNLSFPFSEKE